jgi:hypothetical protein
MLPRINDCALSLTRSARHPESRSRGIEGSRGSYLKDHAMGSLDYARDDEMI